MSLTDTLLLIGIVALVLGAVLVFLGYHRAAHPPVRRAPARRPPGGPVSR